MIQLFPNRNPKEGQEDHLSRSFTLYKIYGLVLFVIVFLLAIKNLVPGQNWIAGVIVFWHQTIAMSTAIGFYFSIDSLIHAKGKRMLALTHAVGYVVIAVVCYVTAPEISELLG